MLVLTRKVGQSILIGNVVVSVTSLEGGRVKLGITAPQDIRIMRFELIDRNNSDACQNSQALKVA